jgi:hypothetical protein
MKYKAKIKDESSTTHPITSWKARDLICLGFSGPTKHFLCSETPMNSLVWFPNCNILNYNSEKRQIQ